MNKKTKKLCVLAMICAVAFILAATIRIPFVTVGNLTLRYDPKDIVIVIGGFFYGPIAALMVAVVVSAIQMFTISITGPFGFLMNVVASGTFCCTAVYIYKKTRTLRGAVLGLAVATVFATAVMLLWNYFIVPLYMPHIPRHVVLGLLLPAFLPFNLISNSLNAALVMLLYKPIKSALQASNLMPEPDSAEKSGKINIGVALGSGFVILTCVLWVLVLQGYI